MATQEHTHPPGRWRSQRGAATVNNAVVVVVVVIAGIVSVSLLARTAKAANRINHKAENIARTGQSINTATTPSSNSPAPTRPPVPSWPAPSRSKAS